MHVLETPRLRLRRVAHEDLDALHRLWTEPALRRHLWDDEVITRQRAAEAIASFAERGFGLWAVCEWNQELVIGFCGLRVVASADYVELVFGMSPARWGRGLASEAVCAVLRFAFEVLRLERVVGMSDAPNAASMRVMEKVGMVREEQRSAAVLVRYTAARTEWAPPPGLTLPRGRA
jgi:ribosomal-protein-alanine N-acetyltransferase